MEPDRTKLIDRETLARLGSAASQTRAAAITETKQAAAAELAAQLQHAQDLEHAARARHEETLTAAEHQAEATRRERSRGIAAWFLAALAELLPAWRDRERSAAAARPVMAMLKECIARCREELGEGPALERGAPCRRFFVVAMAHALYPDHTSAAYLAAYDLSAGRPLARAYLAMLASLELPAPADLAFSRALADLERELEAVVRAGRTEELLMTGDRGPITLPVGETDARARVAVRYISERDQRRELQELDEQSAARVRRDEAWRASTLGRLFPNGRRIVDGFTVAPGHNPLSSAEVEAMLAQERARGAEAAASELAIAAND